MHDAVAGCFRLYGTGGVVVRVGLRGDIALGVAPVFPGRLAAQEIKVSVLGNQKASVSSNLTLDSARGKR